MLVNGGNFNRSSEMLEPPNGGIHLPSGGLAAFNAGELLPQVGRASVRRQILVKFLCLLYII